MMTQREKKQTKLELEQLKLIDKCVLCPDWMKLATNLSISFQSIKELEGGGDPCTLKQVLIRISRTGSQPWLWMPQMSHYIYFDSVPIYKYCKNSIGTNSWLLSHIK